MGKSERRKGYGGEREFCQLTGAKRVPLSGAQEGYFNDVILPNGMSVEVKRRKSGLKFIYDVLEDEREKPDILAYRADRKPWVVCMTLETFQELISRMKG